MNTRIEALESRIAPATLVGKVLTFTDADGDTITVKLATKATVTEAAFEFDSAFATTGAQTLRKINFTNDPLFEGANVRVSVTKNGASNGLAEIGVIEANVDLGIIAIPGDLGRIVAGDADKTLAVKSLSVKTLGLRGAATQAAPASENTVLTGSVGAIAIEDSIFGANITINGGLSTKLGSLKVGGSLFAGGANSANILITGNAAAITILGDIQGAADNSAVSIKVNGNLDKFTLGGPGGGGNIYGGSGLFAGNVQVLGNLKKGTMSGGIFGSTNALTGYFSVGGNLGTFKLKGGIFGGNSSSDYSGALIVGGNANAVTIAGSIFGGNGRYSGYLEVDGFAKNVTVGSLPPAGIVGFSASIPVGGIFGGSGRESGVAYAGGGFGKLTVNGNITSGTGVLSGAIDSNDRIGSLLVRGSVSGTASNPVSITAWHNAAATDKTNKTIGSLKIVGSAQGLLVRAGYNDNALADSDAQIGKVIIGGDFIDSSIVASVVDFDSDGFGGLDDIAAAGFGTVPDSAKLTSSIASITIGGKAGTTAGGPKSFGIVAELIGSVKLGKAKAPLTKGPHNDGLSIVSGTTGSEVTLLIREPGIAV